MHSIEGDFLGVESCVDLRAEMEEDVGKLVGGGHGHGYGFKWKERVKVKREYPPPLPWLARTESSPTAQMPWVMKRSYTEDGRLIITEEKAERYQYFCVHRSDRRLRMDLVQIQVPFWNRPAASDEIPEEEFVPAEMHAGHGGGSDAAEGGAGTAAASDAVVGGGDGDGGSGGGNKYCSGSLVFGVAAVPRLHPLRT